MPNTSVGRVASLLPVLELLEEVENVYVEAEANFASLPRQLKENLSGLRARSMFDELCIFLLTVSPEARQEHRRRLVECAESVRSVIEQERMEGDATSTVLFEPEDLDIIRNVVKALPFITGRRNRRELERFFDAVDTNDLAYMIIKNEPGKAEPHIEVRFAHHMPPETTKALKLPSE